MQGYTTRRAVASDSRIVHELLMQLSRAVKEEHLYQGSEQMLKQQGLGSGSVFEVLLLEHDADVIGMSLFYPEFSTWRCRVGIYIQDLVIHDCRRGRGAGQALLKAVLHFGAEHWDSCYVKLAVHHDNDAAMRFYNRLHFEPDAHSQVMALEPGDYARILGVDQSGVFK